MFVEKDVPAQLMYCGECGCEAFKVAIKQGKVVTICTGCGDESHIQVYAKLEISDSVGCLCRTGRQPDGAVLP